LGKVTVRVVHEAVALPWPDEYVCLYGRRFEASDLDSTSIAASASRARKRVWSRDIVLHIDGVPCVAAHSVTPLRDSKGVWRAMRSLRTRPLAELLYADRTVRRSHLVSRAAANRADPLRALVQRAINIPVAPQRLLARRSLFERHGAPLLVTECFLPAFWAMISAS
jgi:chorismate--pyruvate lyase